MLGAIYTYQRKKRIELLKNIRQMFSDFDYGLREYRQSIEISLKNNGELGKAFINNTPVSWLDQEDRNMIDQAILRISNAGYRDSISISKELLAALDDRIDRLSSDNQGGGKSLPLLTGSFGLLIAVFLF